MEGAGRISIHTNLTDKDIIVDITDTGKGIPKNKQRTVFEPGYSTKKRGWGLGLTLAKRIIESYHNGRILETVQRQRHDLPDHPAYRMMYTFRFIACMFWFVRHILYPCDRSVLFHQNQNHEEFCCFTPAGDGFFCSFCASTYKAHPRTGY